MEGQSISFVNAILSTTIVAVALLGGSSLLGGGLGWLCGLNALTAAISQRIFQLFACWAAVSASPAYCMLWVIAGFTTIGMQKAKLAGNQWSLAISNAFLGMRIGLILFLIITQVAPKTLYPGLGLYIFDAYSVSDVEGLGNLFIGGFSLVALAGLLNIALSLLEKFCVSYIKSRNE